MAVLGSFAAILLVVSIAAPFYFIVTFYVDYEGMSLRRYFIARDVAMAYAKENSLDLQANQKHFKKGSNKNYIKLKQQCIAALVDVDKKMRQCSEESFTYGDGLYGQPIEVVEMYLTKLGVPYSNTVYRDYLGRRVISVDLYKKGESK